MATLLQAIINVLSSLPWIQQHFHFRKWTDWTYQRVLVCLYFCTSLLIRTRWLLMSQLDNKITRLRLWRHRTTHARIWHSSFVYFCQLLRKPRKKWLTVPMNATYSLVVNGTHQITGLSVISTQKKSKRWLWQNQGERPWNTAIAAVLHWSKLLQIKINKKSVNGTQNYL